MSYLEFFFIPYLLDSQLVRWEWTQTLRPAPVLAVGQERNLATGLCRFLAWLCPPFRLYLSWWAFCLPVPTIMAFLFLVLVSSSFFRHLITRKKRGRDRYVSLKNNYCKITVSFLSVMWHPQEGGQDVPCLTLTTLTSGLPSRDRCPPPGSPAQVFTSLFYVHQLVTNFPNSKLGHLTKVVFSFINLLTWETLTNLIIMLHLSDLYANFMEKE